MESLVILITLIIITMLIVGVVLIIIGISEYEEGIAYSGLALMVISILVSVVAIVSVQGHPQPEQDRYTKTSYEQLCAEIGGTYMEVEDEEEGCVVEK